MNRRRFIYASSSVAAVLSLPAMLQAQTGKRAPRILLRSSWQIVNIGDIAHSPGVLALLEKHLPEAETVLWASADLSDEVAAMEHRRFPRLKIVQGTIGPDGKASTQQLAEAIGWADFLLHGSGPALVASRDVAAFVRHTGKTFGVYGITHGSFFSGNDTQILNQARFIFFRDSISLELAKKQGIECPIMEFGPDGAFACDLRNDDAALSFLRANALQEGKFLCCIPRLRYTPYWEIRRTEISAQQRERRQRNEAMAEHDHAPLREAITAVIRNTPLKVLLCPEDRSQMAVGKEWILDRLPADIRKKVVWRENFWLPDEAISTYIRSAGLFGLEMHSPIMCIGNGVPAIVCRFAEQTSKGYMWEDINLSHWLFDFDVETDRKRLPAAVLELAQNAQEAKATAAKALAFVHQRQKETMKVLKDVC